MWNFGDNNKVMLSFLGILCPLQLRKAKKKKNKTETHTVVILYFDTGYHHGKI